MIPRRPLDAQVTLRRQQIQSNTVHRSIGSAQRAYLWAQGAVARPPRDELLLVVVPTGTVRPYKTVGGEALLVADPTIGTMYPTDDHRGCPYRLVGIGMPFNGRVILPSTGGQLFVGGPTVGRHGPSRKPLFWMLSWMGALNQHWPEITKLLDWLRTPNLSD
ncbi:hypothetical protein CRG98_004527 [Punica granatum]|uniref:Uncharacterized protein n=1 Tax=Punica granatum TaxID=22663 RepID=A0A2I0L350_PUNGR|nr:hypothetical protein CRG98_004527 [Punica granatum]